MHYMYNNMIKKGFTKTEVIKAGYFEHPEITTFTDMSFNSTIENYFKEKIYNTQQNNFNVVILTGCFNPLHHGHINILISSYNHIQKLNSNPTVFILCPAHESYSSTKKNNTNDLYGRIQQMKNFIENEVIHPIKHSIVIDSYPATKYKTDVNFTYMIKRYQFIMEYLKVKGKLFFAYGSDNAEFGYVLSVNNIRGICVIRNNDSNRMNNVIENLKNKKCKYHLIHNVFDNEYSTVNSSSLRNKSSMYLVRNDLKYALPNTPKETLETYSKTIL